MCMGDCYSAKTNLKVKVLDFVMGGGPLLVGGVPAAATPFRPCTGV